MPLFAPVPFGKLVTTTWPAVGLTLFYVRFDPAHFDLSQFDQEGIAMPQRIANAARKRQAEYFHGRLCSRAALAAVGDTASQIGSGKQREPLWPAGFTGSITHNADMAVAVALPVSRCAGIGIDVESVADASQSADLQATVVSARERSVIADSRQQFGIDTLATLVFSAKESFYKGIYGLVGRVIDFDVIALVGVDAAAGALWFEVQQALGGQYQPGYRFQIAFATDTSRVLTLFQRPA